MGVSLVGLDDDFNEGSIVELLMICFFSIQSVCFTMLC